MQRPEAASEFATADHEERCAAGSGKDAPGEAAGRASGRTGEREPKLAERSRAGTAVPGAASEGGRAPSSRNVREAEPAGGGAREAGPAGAVAREAGRGGGRRS